MAYYTCRECGESAGYNLRRCPVCGAWDYPFRDADSDGPNWTAAVVIAGAIVLAVLAFAMGR